MKRNKIVCPECGQEISKSNFTKHQRRHQDHPETFEIPKFKLDHDGLDCQFCGKTCKNRNSLCNHERQCNQNPNKQVIYRPGFNDFGRTAWNKGLNKETSEGVKKHSKSLLQWYMEHPDHTQGGFKERSNSRKYKFGTYKGYYCDSSWELAFLVYNIDHGIQTIRNTEAFPYEYEGKVRKYYPDFIIDGVYYELKGIVTERELAKINQFPKELKIIMITQKEIQKYISYCKITYGNDFVSTLYDRHYPSWLDEMGL